jgi:Cdc6-like AAA superfamily ATPase
MEKKLKMFKKLSKSFFLKKVAALSGDLRKALDLMRRAIDLALDEQREREEGEVEGTELEVEMGQLTLEHVNAAIRESTSTVRMDFCRAMVGHEEAVFHISIFSSWGNTEKSN